MRIELSLLALLGALALGACAEEKPKQPEVCARYIACLKDTLIREHNTIAYDANGNCWDGSPERVISCTRACEQALKDFTERTGFCQ